MSSGGAPEPTRSSRHHLARRRPPSSRGTVISGGGRERPRLPYPFSGVHVRLADQCYERIAISWLPPDLPCPGTSRPSAGASDPDDLKVRYGVIAGVLRHDRNAASDRGSSDPASVDRRLAPRRAEPGDHERPDFGHRLAHGEGFEPLRKLAGRQPAGGSPGILGLQHAEPQLPQRYRRDTPLEILETTDVETCSLKADKDGRICQRPLGDHQGRSSVVSVRVARNSSDRPVRPPHRARSGHVAGNGLRPFRAGSGLALGF